jgi:hypothetical protein
VGSGRKIDSLLQWERINSFVAVEEDWGTSESF